MEFLLEPDWAFLNHGSFGACPREVHDEYQRIQRQLESQPVRFIQRELPSLLRDARHRLAEFVGAGQDEVVFVPNPTFAVNALARSLTLGANDQLLTSNHEYGACLNAWRFMQERTGFEIVHQPIELPVTSNESIVEQFWSGVTERTKIIFLSHITSPTALTMPVAEICRRAKQHDIVTIIDGAHVPGQLDIDLQQLDADFYVATCHKWLCAPKGSAFLFAREKQQAKIRPLVVGWGWGQVDRQFDSGCEFVDYFEWLGTHDPSAYLTVPRAIQFQQDNAWEDVQKRCHSLASHAVDQLSEIGGVRRVHDDQFFQQMGLVELPEGTDVKAVKLRLADEFRVEVPVFAWQSRCFVRVSVQAYNTSGDIDQLAAGLRACLG